MLIFYFQSEKNRFKIRISRKSYDRHYHDEQSKLRQLDQVKMNNIDYYFIALGNLTIKILESRSRNFAPFPLSYLESTLCVPFTKKN